MTDRESIIEVVNKLFIYTDNKQWDKLIAEVFTDSVDFDVTSLGGEHNPNKSAQNICADWKEGLQDIDAVNHLAGNYLVTIDTDNASVFCYATATHYKANAKQGNTREFVGTYKIGLVKHSDVWRLNRFRYDLKYASGNMSLE